MYSHNSPIWSPDYLAGVSGGQIPIHTGSTHTPAVLQPDPVRLIAHCVVSAP